jgi:hypothetical protein
MKDIYNLSIAELRKLLSDKKIKDTSKNKQDLIKLVKEYY